MIDPETAENLIAYLDAELPPEQARAVEDLLAGDPEARELLEELRRNDEMIALAESFDMPADYWEGFDDRLLARIQRRGGGAAKRTSRPPRAAGRPRPLRWLGALQMAAGILLAATAAFSIGVRVGGRGGPTMEPAVRKVAGAREEDVLSPENPIGPQAPPSMPWRVVQPKADEHYVPVADVEGLVPVLEATEDALSQLVNGEARVEELQIFQVIVRKTDLIRRVATARDNNTSEPKTYYVLNNTLNVLNRVAAAPPEKATKVALDVQNDVNNLGLLPATQDLLRENRYRSRFQAPPVPVTLPAVRPTTGEAR
jgi:hypothetical protein